MYDLVKLDNQEFSLVIQESAETLKIDESIVEKDFWVSILLDYLFTKSRYKDMFILKGGTSLSKGYSYINRFSEDIDLVIKYTYFDSKIEEILSPSSSTNHRAVLCERLDNLTTEFVQNELLIDIKENFGKLINRDIDIRIDPNDSLTLNFYYPILFNGSYILSFIRIECGSLSSLGPTEEVKVNPLVYQANPEIYPKDKNFPITVYSPVKTFWEKVEAIHVNSVKPESKQIGDRFSRHLYDIYCLGHSDIKEKAFDSSDLLDETIHTADAFYHYGWLDINQMLRHEFQLVPSKDKEKKLREDYESMKRMIWKDAPSFDELINYLKELEEEIKNI